MIEENKKIKIELEIKKAMESYKAAQVLFKEELYDDAVSSAYYSMFHMAKALLLTIDQSPATHQGVISLFGLHFIKTNHIEKIYSDLIIDAKEARESGDYDVTQNFNRLEAEEKLSNAKMFNRRISLYLKEANFIAEIVGDL